MKINLIYTTSWNFFLLQRLFVYGKFFLPSLWSNFSHSSTWDFNFRSLDNVRQHSQIKGGAVDNFSEIAKQQILKLPSEVEKNIEMFYFFSSLFSQLPDMKPVLRWQFNYNRKLFIPRRISKRRSYTHTHTHTHRWKLNMKIPSGNCEWNRFKINLDSCRCRDAGWRKKQIESMEE